MYYDEVFLSSSSSSRPPISKGKFDVCVCVCVMIQNAHTEKKYKKKSQMNDKVGRDLVASGRAYSGRARARELFVAILCVCAFFFACALFRGAEIFWQNFFARFSSLVSRFVCCWPIA